MTLNESGPMDVLTCAQADELDAAFALGALDPPEQSAVVEHLATCPQPHEELRSMLGAADVLSATLEPVPPSPGLRDRVMTTIAATPQERPAAVILAERQAGAVRPSEHTRPVAAGRGWLDWLTPGLARGMAAAGLALALVFGGLSLYLQGQVSSRDQALRAVASAISRGETAFRASGSQGAGYVVADASGNASLVTADLTPPSENRLYELWLIGPDGKPVAVATFGGSPDPVAVVPLERGLSGYTTFAVTIEARRVDAPTSNPVMVAKLT